MLGPDGGSGIKEAQDSSWGILPRSIFFIFDELRRRVLEDGAKYQVKISYMQIYNEIINDLLREKVVVDDYDDSDGAQSGLKIREYVESCPDGLGTARRQEIFVSGLSEFRAETAEDVLALLLLGSNNRSTRSTECNASSSRSHAILQLTFEIENHIDDGQIVINRSKLSFVDLAGSEKIITLGNDSDPKHLKELTSINKSLSSLGNVIAALAKGRPHVPYRDSKLTRLLQDSLGGNTRTLLIACIAPTVMHAAETFNTLQFADRASSVMVRVRPNVVIDDKALLARAQVEVARLKRLLRFVMSGNGEKGPGAFHLNGVGASFTGHISKVIGTEHNSKHSAILEAMALGAHAGRSGAGDDEAAADSEMIRLLDENESLRKDNMMLHHRCHRLQARLNVNQNNNKGFHQIGAWSPVKDPGTAQRKAKRMLTDRLSKRHGNKSNPYIAHLPKECNGYTTQSDNPSGSPRSEKDHIKSAGGVLQISKPLDLPHFSTPSPEEKTPESSCTLPFDIDNPYNLPEQLVKNDWNSHVHVQADSIFDITPTLSPVRGVIRIKSKGGLSVGFSDFPAEGSSANDGEVHEKTQILNQEKKEATNARTPLRSNGMRNPYASLTPVLRKSQPCSSKSSKAKINKNERQACKEAEHGNVNNSRERRGRAENIRDSAEWYVLC